MIITTARSRSTFKIYTLFSLHARIPGDVYLRCVKRVNYFRSWGWERHEHGHGKGDRDPLFGEQRRCSICLWKRMRVINTLPFEISCCTRITKKKRKRPRSSLEKGVILIGVATLCHRRHRWYINVGIGNVK